MEEKITKWMKSENKFFTIMSYGTRIENQDVVMWCIGILSMCAAIVLMA